MGALPPVFIEFLGSSAGVRTAMAGVKAELAAADTAGAGAFAKTGMLGKAALLGLGVAAATVAAKTVHMAGDFQLQMTRVRTGAGEAAANMKMVGDGVLAMAGRVGQSTEELTAGLYMVESAGYHGADALKVLETSAQGAKVGAADLKTTTDAVTTAMNAYKMGSGEVTTAMNALIATEAEGKTNLEALAGSMSSILPVAAAAHVRLNEVMGAMATMTAQGTPAAVAATYLRQTIGQLSNPSGKAAKEMESLGLSAVQVGQRLGKEGLASTLTLLTDAIEKHMGPAGTVLISHLQKAAANTSEYEKVLANLSPAQQTYVGALATMVGGTKSMQAALQLTGPHMQDFIDKTRAIDEHVEAGGKSVEGWSDVQKNFNQQVAQAKASLESMGIQIGQYLMPVVQRMVQYVARGASWLAQHTVAAKIAAGVIGGILLFSIVALTAALWGMAVAAAVNPVTWIVLAIVVLIAEIVLLATHWRQVWAFIKAVAGAAADWIVARWGQFMSRNRAIWNGITAGVRAAWHGLAAFFVAGWHLLTDPIVHAWNWVTRVTTAAWNRITSFFRTWWPLLLVIFAPAVAVVMSIWNHFHAVIVSTAVGAWHMIANFFSQLWSQIKAAAAVIWGGVESAIITPIMTAWGWLVAAWHAISGWLRDHWAGIRSSASSIWGGIRDSMITPLVHAYNTINSTMDRIGASIRDGLRSAWNGVRQAASWFWDIGSGIVQGIVNGIRAGAGWLYSTLRNLASDALASAKSFLGINSPSKVFADEVGMGIPEGVAMGVTDHAHLAVASVHSLSGLIARQQVAGPSLALAGSPSTRFGAAGGAGHTTHVHVTVQGSVLAERDLRDVVQTQMLRLGARNSQTYQPYKR